MYGVFVAGIIYCDLKPENILLQEDGRIFLSNGLWGSSPQQNFYKNKRSLLTKQKEKGNIQNNNKL